MAYNELNPAPKYGHASETLVHRTLVEEVRVTFGGIEEIEKQLDELVTQLIGRSGIKEGTMGRPIDEPEPIKGVLEGMADAARFCQGANDRILSNIARVRSFIGVPTYDRDTYRD